MNLGLVSGRASSQRNSDGKNFSYDWKNVNENFLLLGTILKFMKPARPGSQLHIHEKSSRGNNKIAIPPCAKKRQIERSNYFLEDDLKKILQNTHLTIRCLHFGYLNVKHEHIFSH